MAGYSSTAGLSNAEYMLFSVRYDCCNVRRRMHPAVTELESLPTKKNKCQIYGNKTRIDPKQEAEPRAAPYTVCK